MFSLTRRACRSHFVPAWRNESPSMIRPIQVGSWVQAFSGTRLALAHSFVDQSQTRRGAECFSMPLAFSGSGFTGGISSKAQTLLNSFVTSASSCKTSAGKIPFIPAISSILQNPLLTQTHRRKLTGKRLHAHSSASTTSSKFVMSRGAAPTLSWRTSSILARSSGFRLNPKATS